MKKKKLDKYSKHEFLDRTYLAMVLFSDYVADHPALPKKYKKKAEKVVSSMFDFYQEMGSLALLRKKDKKKLG